MKSSTLRKVLSYVRRHGFPLALTIVLAAVTVGLTLYVPILVGDAIDCIVEAGKVDFAAISPILIRIAVVVGITALTQWLSGVINNRITYRVVQDIRADAFRKIQVLPLSYIDSHSHGDTVSRIITDVDQFADGLLMGFTQLFSGVVTILATIGFMLSVNPLITLVVVLATPLSLFVARFIARRTGSLFRKQSELRGEQTAFLNEMLQNQKVVKAFSHEKANEAQFDELNDRLEDSSLHAVFYSSLVNPCTRFLNSIVYAIVALCGALVCFHTGGAALTVGGLSCFLSYANQYTKPFNEISGVVTELQNAFACAARIFELIDAPAQSPDAQGELADCGGEVEFDSVDFSYVPEKPLIENLNLSIRSGEHVAIVGPTGCGKTTLINLLMRFYDVDKGVILVDGTDVRSVPRHVLRAQYGMVLQDTWIRDATVWENIALGKPDATREEIIAAAKAAHSHSFIKRLPQGYDTVISEDSSLSQGQRQLLCITRVMLSPPPMLILDEATSSIDTRTEMLIQEAFAKLTAGRTSFIVAHRLSTIREADQILVMRDGHIIEQGSHEQLLEKNGFYAALYHSQFEP